MCQHEELRYCMACISEEGVCARGQNTTAHVDTNLSALAKIYSLVSLPHQVFIIALCQRRLPTFFSLKHVT